MSKFTDDLRGRLAEIAELIRTANTSERRKLQKERTDLEQKLAKVSA